MSIRANVDRTALNERITLQRRTNTQDPDTGDISVSWAKLVEVWAKVDGQKASEVHAAGSTRGPNAYIVWVRSDVQARFRLTDTDRILWRGSILDVKDVLDQQLRGRLVAISCLRGMSEG